MSGKRRIGKFDEATMREAVLQVVKHGRTIRGVAKDFKLSYATVRQYVSKYTATDNKNREYIRFSPNYEVNLVFSEELEIKLEEYLVVARRLHYSLSGDDVRRLSYDLAVKHNLKIPPSWVTSKKAGKHWMYGFLKRRPLVKKMFTLSKKFRASIEKPDCLHKKIITDNPDELILSSNKLEELIETDEEEVDVSSKPVIIIPVRRQKG